LQNILHTFGQPDQQHSLGFLILNKNFTAIPMVKYDNMHIFEKAIFFIKNQFKVEHGVFIFEFSDLSLKLKSLFKLNVY